MSCSLSLRSFCSERRSNRRILSGVSAGSRRQSGSDFSTSLRISLTESPRNAACPVSISYSTHPNPHTSDVRSASRPFACSGDMYAAVPRIIPGRVAAIMVGELDRPAPLPSTSRAFASPKSSTLTVPSARTLIFAGFRSRCVMPISWAASSPFRDLPRDRKCLRQRDRSYARSDRRGSVLRRAPSQWRGWQKARSPILRDREWMQCWDG